MPGQAPRQRYKVVVLGPPAAGKTALVRRLAGGSFEEGSSQRGLDWYSCHIPLRDDTSVTLQLWDLSACPVGPSTEDDHSKPNPLLAYLFGTQAVLAMYDVSDPASLEALRHALDFLDSTYAVAADAGGTRPYVALVANKCDLRWSASEPLARQLAARHGCVRFALSARTGEGVAAAAVQLACDLAGVPLTATDYYCSGGGIGINGEGCFASPAGKPCAGDDSQVTLVSKQPPGGVDAAFGFVAQHWAGLEQPRAYEAEALGDDPLQGRVYRALPEPARSQARASAGTTPALGTADGREPQFGSSGHGAQLWRPVSRRATPSSTALVIGRTGPLGQRSTGRSASPVAASGTTERAANAAAAAGTGAAGAAGQAVAPLERGSGAGRTWRAVLGCCCGHSHGRSNA